jgi:hypothetical protein
MTKFDGCHGSSVICDEIYDEIGRTSSCLDFISGFISSTANLWRNLTVCHGCSVIYDEIKKRHENFVMDQRISCSVPLLVLSWITKINWNKWQMWPCSLQYVSRREQTLDSGRSHYGRLVHIALCFFDELTEMPSPISPFSNEPDVL